MKNSSIFYLLSSLPLLIAGCSAEPAEEARLEGDFQVVMSVSSTDPETRATLSEENAIDNSRLFFGTYNSKFEVKDPLYEAGKANNDVEAIFFTPNWGPSVAATLPKDKYKDNFYTVAYSLPANMNSATKLGGAKDPAFTTLSWPAPGAVWEPGASAGNIPMAGIQEVTAQYMADHYRDPVFGHNPMQLPTIGLTRAMAKVVIVDLNGIIASVTLSSPDKGTLVPDLESWMNSSVVTRPVTASGAAFFDQTLSAPNAKVDGKDAYVFYTFESSFYGADGKLADAAGKARELITLRSNKASLGTSHISFAPYAGGEISSGINLSSYQNGVWQGVMRNTIYTFRLSQPSNAGMSVEVTPGSWSHYNEEFHF